MRLGQFNDEDHDDDDEYDDEGDVGTNWSIWQVVYEPRCKSRDPSPNKPVSRAPSRAGVRKLSRARTPSIKAERLVRGMTLPETPSPSTQPLLQLGESCEIEDCDKLTRIRELEDNVRIQEEVVINLREKLENGLENGDGW